METGKKPATISDNGKGELLALAGHVRYASFGEGGVVFELDTRQSHRLNHTAASVVDLVLRGHTVTDIIECLAADNPAEASKTETDVKHFLGDITNRGWIIGH